MRSSDAFPSKYLKSTDAKAAPIVATISGLEQEAVGPEKQDKWVLHLDGQKPMVLNRTNFEAIEDAFGDSDDWSGHKIKIKTVRTSFQGKSVDGLRVEPIVPKPATKDDLNDGVAF
jgi:hypothetical protein